MKENFFEDANVYVVLNDSNTYSSEDDSFIAFMKEAGERQLNVSPGFADVSPENFVKVPVKELIEAWLKCSKPAV